MPDADGDLYVITLLDSHGDEDWWLASIDVEGKYLKLTDWGVSLTGCWTELVCKRSDDGQQYGFQVGRCFLPWARIDRIEDKQDNTKDFGDFDAWAQRYGLNADDIRAQEKVHNENAG
ncbi:hypothetical protein [Kitasatospora phosalacinea]|uniref:Uncharacterized protein n=1 Tax=Kitasatospora phosalacinea TaxID=2065 RepID=A0A9W6URA1_9ACTN|nr:hypothetical protein [Kitasatospora phosalacinea]GLW58079.1 hypothetical protein Kpho01_60900 [Kitasatospora phosalacinea]